MSGWYSNVDLFGGTFTGSELAIKSDPRSLKKYTKDLYRFADENGNTLKGVYEAKSVVGPVCLLECTHAPDDKGFRYDYDSIDHVERHIATCFGCGKNLSDDEEHDWNDNGNCTVCEAVAVAEVGGTKFSKLDYAISKANETGCEVNLIADAEVDSKLSVSNLTVNGNGHTITFNCDVIWDEYGFKGAITINNRGSLTLNNVTLQAGEGYEFFSLIYNNGGSINVKNCTINGNSTTENGIYNKGNLIITGDSKINGVGGTGINMDNAGSVSLEECTIMGFENAINTSAGDSLVSNYLAENCYCWSDESTINTATDVPNIAGGVTIRPCTHGNATFTDNGDTHTGTCDICAKNFTAENAEEHTYNSEGKCTVCGSIAKVKITKDNVSSYTNSLENAFTAENTGATITLL